MSGARAHTRFRTPLRALAYSRILTECAWLGALQLRTNAGAIVVGDQQVGCSLSSNLSMFNHSCAPNSAAAVTAGRLRVTALRPIAPGEELTICCKSKVTVYLAIDGYTSSTLQC